jgi:WD40 repeat protein
MFKLTTSTCALTLLVASSLYGMNPSTQSSIRPPVASSCGQKIVTMTAEGAQIWNKESGELLHTITNRSGVMKATLSSDCSKVLTVDRLGSAQLADSESGVVLATLPGPVSSATFSPDNTMLLTLDQEGNAKVWYTENGVLAGSIKGPFSSATFNPENSQLLLTGTAVVSGTNEEGEETLWDLKNHRRLRTIHAGLAQSATFSEDGSKVITVSADGTTKIWDVASGKLLETIIAGKK